MAITFVNNSTADSAGALSLTIAIPTGAVAGDFMIAFVKQSENTGQQTWDDDGGGGNGWTRLDYHRTTGGRDQETAVYYKFHTGTESNPTFTWNTSGTTEPMSGSIVVYRGVDAVTPINNFAWAWAQNDSTPPNPTVTVGNQNSWVVCIHAATHDDINSPAPPTGYVMRSQVYGGSGQHSSDHRDHFIADSNGAAIPIGSYTPPDWQHGFDNNTPEYQTYSLVLNEVQVIGVTGYTDKFQYGATNLSITGFGFGATQGTGRVELWSDTSGTIKTLQTIDSWSDTSITFTSVQGSLQNNTTVYLVITNDNGDVTGTNAVLVGIPGYRAVVNTLAPDHWWALDGDYVDTGVGGARRDMTSSVIGTQVFVSAIAEDATQALLFDDVLDRREITDSPYMNVTISSAERTVGGWIQLGVVQKSLACLWKEGGGVQNLAFLTGLGNTLMAQLADVAGSRDNVQAVSAFKLTPNRPYHITLRYTHLENPKEMRLFIDGVEQPLELTSGNPMTLGIFDSHSGDVVWGDPDNNLETGGTDISYNGPENCVYQHWFSWSDNSPSGGALDKTTEIRDVLFRRGAKPKYTIASDTAANMQAALDAFGVIEVPDWPLGIRVEAPTDGNDLILTATGVTFNDRVTDHLEWRGVGTLTWVVGSGSNIDDNKTFSTGGGLIVIQRPAIFTINNIIPGSEVRIYDDEIPNDLMFNTELAGIESNPTSSFSYSHSGATNTIMVQVMKAGYVEILYPFVLDNTNQTLTIEQEIDINV